MDHVGFIGLGNQGAPMARRIVEDGFPLTLWARREASLEPFADTAAATAASPAELGAASQVVCICVFADDDVADVILRDDGVLAGMAGGGVIAIHSTVRPETCAHIAERAAERDVAVIDAPVSGSGIAATERRLLVMAGGDPAALDRCRPVFETFANPIVHLGALGRAQMAKAINNTLLAAHMAVAMDAFALAAELEVDQAGLAEALAHGTGGSVAAGIVAQAGFNSDYLRTNSEPYFSKDLELMAHIAASMGVTNPDFLLDTARHALPRGPHRAGRRSRSSPARAAASGRSAQSSWRVPASASRSRRARSRRPTSGASPATSRPPPPRSRRSAVRRSRSSATSTTARRSPPPSTRCWRGGVASTCS